LKEGRRRRGRRGRGRKKRGRAAEEEEERSRAREAALLLHHHSSSVFFHCCSLPILLRCGDRELPSWSRDRGGIERGSAKAEGESEAERAAAIALFFSLFSRSLRSPPPLAPIGIVLPGEAKQRPRLSSSPPLSPIVVSEDARRAEEESENAQESRKTCARRRALIAFSIASAAAAAAKSDGLPFVGPHLVFSRESSASPHALSLSFFYSSQDGIAPFLLEETKERSKTASTLT
jgi:hypothetical protein